MRRLIQHGDQSGHPLRPMARPNREIRILESRLTCRKQRTAPLTNREQFRLILAQTGHVPYSQHVANRNRRNRPKINDIKISNRDKDHPSESSTLTSCARELVSSTLLLGHPNFSVHLLRYFSRKSRAINKSAKINRHIFCEVPGRYIDVTSNGAGLARLTDRVAITTGGAGDRAARKGALRTRR
jgi:hypothetical protein